MKYIFVGAMLAAMLGILGTGAWQLMLREKPYIASDAERKNTSAEKEKVKSIEERIAEAREKSSQIKGLYVTADVANDQGAPATRIRENILRLATHSEINGLVIDVKEVCGPDYEEKNIKKFLEEIHGKNIWAIARIVVFSDASERKVNPQWYLKRKTPKKAPDPCIYKKRLEKPGSSQEGQKHILWQDRAGKYYLDPAHPEVQEAIVDFSKKIIDLGFDELQFDYIRFPSDGDIKNIVYPYYDGKTPKCRVMQNFFELLSRSLRSYKPDIILSVDLFGYAAMGIDTGIGQCLDQIGENFDYVSFMLYPSHYYGGLVLKGDPLRSLPAIQFSPSQVRANPDVVVERSLRFARDFWDGKITLTGNPASGISTSSAAISSTTTPILPDPKTATSSKTLRLRPWLEDFYHQSDKDAGRPYGVEKIRRQIDAAERVEQHGWLLWNAENVYTEGALRSK